MLTPSLQKVTITLSFSYHYRIKLNYKLLGRLLQVSYEKLNKTTTLKKLTKPQISLTDR